MQFSFKELFRKFHELPEKLTPEHYRFFVFKNYAFFLAGIFHFAFILVFAILGIKFLSIYNIFSSVLWAFLIYLNFRGSQILPFVLANIEICIHAVLSVVIIGWDSGFYYYFLAIPLISFLSLWPKIAKILICIFNGIALVLLNYYANIVPPLSTINVVYLNWLGYANLLGIVFAISYCAYYYRLIVLRVEKKLEVEHQRTTEALNRLKAELSDAAEYVKTILPEPINEGPVRSKWEFIPSESLGGDAFGYHWLDKDNFAIYLLDVSGHGVSAALLSATITNVLRSRALPRVDFCEPDQVLTGLNRSFPAEENNDMFFTIWYGVYNRHTNALTYASGGHPAALLFSGSSSENTQIEELRTPNYVVGGMKDAGYKKDVQNLKPNSCLYVFSDGVYEFRQFDGSRWNYREFANYLSNLHFEEDKDIDQLVNSAKDLKQSSFEDDFTILKISFY
jgi:sigma-B regulation protein RsbU (phosphoserine phosphatase)